MSDRVISHVTCGEDYILDIILDNGERILFDIKPKVTTARFKELSDLEIFKKGIVIGGRYIRWPTGLELSLDEIKMYEDKSTYKKGKK